MLDLGNIVVARPMLERAANEGSAEAAALLAATFDRIWLQRTGALGIADDSAKAAHWYAQARQLGAGDAERIIAETIKR